MAVRNLTLRRHDVAPLQQRVTTRGRSGQARRSAALPSSRTTFFPSQTTQFVPATAHRHHVSHHSFLLQQLPQRPSTADQNLISTRRRELLPTFASPAWTIWFSLPVVRTACFGDQASPLWEIDYWFGKGGDVREIAFDTLWERGYGVDFVMGNAFWGLVR